MEDSVTTQQANIKNLLSQIEALIADSGALAEREALAEANRQQKRAERKRVLDEIKALIANSQQKRAERKALAEANSQQERANPLPTVAVACASFLFGSLAAKAFF